MGAAHYGALLEDIFRLGLAWQEIPFQSVSHNMDGKGRIRVDVVLRFSPDLPELERFIKSQLIVDEKRSKMLRDTEDDEFTALEYVARLGPSRSKLPEWRPFEGETFHISVSTALGDLLQKALEHFPESPSGEGIENPGKRDLQVLASRLEDALAALYLKESFPFSLEDLPAGTSPVEVDHAREPELQEAPETEEDSPGLESLPEPESPERSEREPADEASLPAEELLTFFRTHPNVLDRWWSVASESGLDLAEFDSGMSGPDSPGFRDLLTFFRNQGVTNIHEVTDFVTQRLGRWESLYASLETARIRRKLPSGRMTVFEFALALLAS
jgi:hypothetical protein